MAEEPSFCLISCATSSKAIATPNFQPVTLLLGSVYRAVLQDALAAGKAECILHCVVSSPWHPPSLLSKPSWSLVSTDLNNVLTANPGAPKVLLASTESGGCPPLASQGQQERVSTGRGSMCPAAEQTLLRVFLETPAPLM